MEGFESIHRLWRTQNIHCAISALNSNAALSAENAVRVDPFYCSSQDTNPLRGTLGSMKTSLVSSFLPN
jgi:hypothetical protein